MTLCEGMMKSTLANFGCLLTQLCFAAILVSAGSANAQGDTASSAVNGTTAEVTEEQVLEPGDYVPPYVQLTDAGPSVPWDASEVSPFHLIDQTGADVTRESLLGKPWVANFIFARCVVQCPANCKRIKELSLVLKDVDVRFVTITVDPEHDKLPIMREYAQIWGATPDRWLFCTGEPDEVWKLIRTGFKVAAWEEVGSRRLPGMEFAHSNHLIHVDANGKIMGRYSATNELEVTALTGVLKGEITTPERHQPANIALLEAQKARRLAEAEIARNQTKSGQDTLANLPEWAQRLPATNAMLNGLATILLLMGYVAIKAKQRALHKQLMLTAFAVSVAFLACYLTYHGALTAYTESHGKPFPGTGNIRYVYFTILITHVFLAALVPIGACASIWYGLRENWPVHKRWAVVTFPIWLYVSVTGVIIYWMLYRMY